MAKRMAHKRELVKCRECKHLGEEISYLINHCFDRNHGVRYFREWDCNKFEKK